MRSSSKLFDGTLFIHDMEGVITYAHAEVALGFTRAQRVGTHIRHGWSTPHTSSNQLDLAAQLLAVRTEDQVFDGTAHAFSTGAFVQRRAGRTATGFTARRQAREGQTTTLQEHPR